MARPLLLALMFVFLVDTVLADAVEVQGKLTEVAAEERTISIQGKTLEVPRRCKVVINDETAELATLRAGQIAVVKYDDALEIATAITIGDSPSGEPLESISLFNGRNLSGWRYLGDKSHVATAWSARPGSVLECSGADDIAPLLTDEKYKNFSLTLEWRFPPGVTPTQDGLGLAVRVTDTDLSRQLRYQLQDRADSAMWVIGQSEAPNPLLGRIIKAFKDPLVKGPAVEKKPLGEWNSVTISCVGEEVAVEQNGKETIHVKAVDAVAGYIAFIPAKTRTQIRSVILVPK